MDNTDDDLMHQRIAESFTQGTFFTDEELLRLIHEHDFETSP